MLLRPDTDSTKFITQQEEILYYLGFKTNSSKDEEVNLKFNPMISSEMAVAIIIVIDLENSYLIDSENQKAKSHLRHELINLPPPISNIFV